jgi:putative transposase
MDGELLNWPKYGGFAMDKKTDAGLTNPVASVIGFLKGKSAIAIARLCGKERNFTGEHFWARGYAVSTVGFELEQVRTYFREQDTADGAGDHSKVMDEARNARRLDPWPNRL